MRLLDSSRRSLPGDNGAAREPANPGRARRLLPSSHPEPEVESSETERFPSLLSLGPPPDALSYVSVGQGIDLSRGIASCAEHVSSALMLPRRSAQRARGGCSVCRSRSDRPCARSARCAIPTPGKEPPRLVRPPPLRVLGSANSLG